MERGRTLTKFSDLNASHVKLYLNMNLGVLWKSGYSFLGGQLEAHRFKLLKVGFCSHFLAKLSKLNH